MRDFFDGKTRREHLRKKENTSSTTRIPARAMIAPAINNAAAEKIITPIKVATCPFLENTIYLHLRFLGLSQNGDR
jgi:hypothetical protein